MRCIFETSHYSTVVKMKTASYTGKTNDKAFKDANLQIIFSTQLLINEYDIIVLCSLQHTL
jgi:hypothetical protein